MVGLYDLSFYPRNPPTTTGCISLQLFFRPITDARFTAVAARFGIGKDFWVNLVLTLCGYIPGKLIFANTLNPHPLIPRQGHGHNFYIQVLLKHAREEHLH